VKRKCLFVGDLEAGRLHFEGLLEDYVGHDVAGYCMY
jgi:hypothetical protein